MTTDREYERLLDDAKQGYRVERFTTVRGVGKNHRKREYLCPCGRWVWAAAETTHSRLCNG